MLLALGATVALAAAVYLTPKSLELVEPGYPYQARDGGDVFFDFAVGDDGVPRDIRVRRPTPPFTPAAARALAQWKFELPPAAEGELAERRIALVWQFRAPQPLSQRFIERSYDATLFGTPQDRPPVPTTITEAAQPIQVVNEGTAVLAVVVDERGKVKVIRPLNRAGALTDAATDAVRRWRFAPALEAGEPATGELLLAVTFPRPVTAGPPPRPHR